MKKIQLLIATIAIVLQVNAQINIPRLSPMAKIEQQVGLGKVSIEYGRPSLRGRQLLGKSGIPFSKIWRLGANEVTRLTINEDMMIEGKAIAKGVYALAAIPDANEWTIVINSDTAQWGMYDYKQEKDVMRFNVKAQKETKKTETMTFSFEDVQPSTSNLVFRWENVSFKIAFLQDVDARVKADIKEKLAKKDADAWVFIEAAEYNIMVNKDLEQALAWVTQALEKEKESAFAYNLHAEIAQKLGKCTVAIESAQKALPIAEKNKDEAAKNKAQDTIKSCRSKK